MIPRRTLIHAALGAAAPLRQAFGRSPAERPVPQGGTEASRVRIVCNSSSPAEACAASELRDFVRAMTGVSPALVESAAPGTTTFLVGRTSATRQLISSGAIPDPALQHPEAYVVRSLPSGEVVLVGGTGIATLYAVYHYLEKCCGVGFFCDGDHVPRRELVPAGGIDIATAPRFSERVATNLTIYWYSAPWWHWDDWRQYIDYLIKSRFNILALWDSPGEDVVWHAAWKKLGVEIADQSYSGPPFGIFAPFKYGVQGPQPAAWREGQGELTRKIIQYARARGMKFVAPAVAGIVPPEFKRVYPDARTFELSWPTRERYSQQYLHPADPMYRRLGKAFLEEFIQQYGTDHIYWLENYLECQIHGPEELQHEVRREIGGANFKVMDEVDPRGVGLLSTWTYLSEPSYWPRELVKEHLARVPRDRVRIVDQTTADLPQYKEFDYFDGRPWYLGIVYSFASDTHLHGNMRLLERQLKGVARDPRAARCVGFYPNEEAVRHNYFYFGFQAKLGWNPAEVELRAYTREFARVRYGVQAAPAMEAVLDALLSTVYGAPGSTKPLYWHRPSTTIDVRYVVRDPAYFSRLRRAVEMAWAAGTDLESNRLYLHDLNDMARQYLAELYNARMLDLNASVAVLDVQGFERHAAALETLLDGIEQLLSHDDDYWLSPLIRKARRLPGAPADVDRRARDIMTLWAGVIRDYACRDYYEMVQSYYRPRLRIFLEELRLALRYDQRGIWGLRTVHLEQQYDTHEKGWVANGFPLVERKPEPRRVVETVGVLLKKTAAIAG